MKVYHLPYPVVSHPVVIGKLLYAAFCNRISNFSSVLCFLWNGVGIDSIMLLGVSSLLVKCAVSSVLGNSSL